MASLNLNQFLGIVPRAPGHLLPSSCAQTAHDCDLAHGELRPLRDKSLLRAASVNARTIFRFRESAPFFWWDQDVDAAYFTLSGRGYWTDGVQPKMCRADSLDPSGGYITNYRPLGIPRPTVKASITLVDKTTLPGWGYQWRGWYEKDGVKYQDQELIGQYAPVLVTFGRVWTGAFPARDAATPPDAIAAGCLIITDTTKGNVEIGRIHTSHSYFAKYDNSGFVPGGAYLTSAGSGDNIHYTMTMTYGKYTSRSYIFTYVSDLGEESAPSPPSDVVSFDYLQEAKLSFPPVPAGYPWIIDGRLYRTSDSSSGNTDYFYAGNAYGQIDPDGTYHDSKKDSELGEVCPSIDWDVPDPNMQGLVMLPNGSLAGFSGNEVCFSEPYIPHAWPRKYRVAIDWPIVALAVHGNAVVALTTAYPYMISGSHPSSMTPVKSPLAQACLAKRAVCDTGSAIVYACPDGLAFLSGGMADTSVSDNFFTKDEWAALVPPRLLSSLRLRYHDGRIHGFHADGGFVLTLSGAAPSFITLSTPATDAFVVPDNDTLYLLSGGSIYTWRGSTGNLALTWKSKAAILPKPICFGAAQVIAEGAWTVSVYADGVLKHTESGTDNKTFRLPAGFVARKWEYQVTGTATIKEIYFATTMLELAGV